MNTINPSCLHIALQSHDTPYFNHFFFNQASSTIYLHSEHSNHLSSTISTGHQGASLY